MIGDLHTRHLFYLKNDTQFCTIRTTVYKGKTYTHQSLLLNCAITLQVCLSSSYWDLANMLKDGCMEFRFEPQQPKTK